MGRWKKFTHKKLKRAKQMKQRFTTIGWTDANGDFHPFAEVDKPEAWRKAGEVKGKAKPTLKKVEPKKDWNPAPKGKPVEVEYLYFAYGSNLNLSQFSARCPNATKVEAMELPGYKLVFKGVADIVKAEGRTVSGALYRITNHCEHALDRYEGFPSLYRKEFVTLEDGREVMFYVMNRYTLSPPYQTYFDTIWYGYQDWDMDQQPLLDALAEQGIGYSDGPPSLEKPRYPAYTSHRSTSGWNKPKPSGSYGQSEHWRYGNMNADDQAVPDYGADDQEVPDYGSDAYWQGVLDGEWK